MKSKNFLLDYQYAIGLTIGALIGVWLSWAVISFIILVWAIVIAERIFR